MSHLDDNAMTYWQHFRFAACHSVRCLVASVKLFAHACIPDVFQTAGRNLVCRMRRDFTCDDDPCQT